EQLAASTSRSALPSMAVVRPAFSRADGLPASSTGAAIASQGNPVGHSGGSGSWSSASVGTTTIAGSANGLDRVPQEPSGADLFSSLSGSTGPVSAPSSAPMPGGQNGLQATGGGQAGPLAGGSGVAGNS